MSAKLSTIWDAPPHTIAKIAILGSYLHIWFSILRHRFPGRDLWYVDGFAGPGEYTNYADGSPRAALKAAESALKEVGGSGNIHCVFIEEDKKRFAHLEQKLSAIPEHPKIKHHVYPGTFVEGVARLRGEAVNPFVADSPTFAFIDPFGPGGLSFAAVRELLSGRKCEVLVNLDSDGISRIFSAGKAANHSQLLNDIYGDDEWVQEFGGVHTHAARVAKALSLYKQKLMAIPNVQYSFAFEMRKEGNAFDYHLVFASQHPTGLEKMKEVMKKMDQDGSYCFSDANIDQHMLFRDANDPERYAKDLFIAFKGQTVSYMDTNRFALNETPFINPKKMLKALERDGTINVICLTPKRKKGTFPDESHAGMEIQFRSDANS